MITTVSYETPTLAGIATVNTTVTTSEAEVLKVLDLRFTQQSQITAYFKITLGSATSVKFRYYMTPDSGTTWFQVPIKNSATGLLADIPTVIDATSPTQSGAQYVVEDIPFSASYGLRITAQSVAANATLNTLKVVTRNN